MKNVQQSIDFYDKFAIYYDEFIGRYIQDIYLNHLSIFFNCSKVSNKEILELGCGTGGIIRELSANNRCTGIDASASMIKIARGRDSFSEYIVADVNMYSHRKKYDAIICAYDTINHLISFNEWEKLVASSAQSLKEGGLFCFDYNSINRFNGKQRKLCRTINSKHICLSVKKTSKYRRVYYLHMDTKSSCRNISMMREAVYPERWISNMINKYFSNVNYEKMDSGRIFVSCTMPHK